MSYRSIKLALGETSLERKCRFLFAACLLFLIITSFWLYGYRTEGLVHEQNRNTGRLLVNQVLIYEHFYNWENRSQDWRDLIRDLDSKLQKEEFDYRFIKPNHADGTGKPQDDFEWEVFDQFMKAKPEDYRNPEANYRWRIRPENNEYQYYQPIRAQNSCLLASCHAPPPGGLGIDTTGTGTAMGNRMVPGGYPMAEGDLMAIAKISLPYGPTQHAMNINRAVLLATAIITVFLAMIASYAIVRYVIVKPLRHLRDVSDAISRGNTALRAEIHTGDEFESLAVAFNRMLRHLVTAQEELRQVNTDLDAKIDELAQANMRLYEMNRIKSDFLATMSHELRTPLNSILGFSDVLRDIDALDEKQKRYVQNIQSSGRILLEMINNILDLAKIESGKMDVRLSEFRIENVLGALCDMARPLSEKKNIDLEAQIEPNLPPMHQDQNRVQQVLNNLLSNAIKFTPEGGRVKVVARRDEYNYLLLQVIDTGVGIAEDDQQTIFEKFRQVRTGLPGGGAITREYSGTGLGLSIVKELCKLLGGEVSVESTLGRGSSFTVRLPWRLEEQPRLDSPVDDGLAEFANARFDLAGEAIKSHSPPQAAE